VYVATGMEGAGHLKHFGRGELLIGDLNNEHLVNDSIQDELQMLTEIFGSSGVPCDISKTLNMSCGVSFW